MGISEGIWRLVQRQRWVSKETPVPEGEDWIRSTGEGTFTVHQSGWRSDQEAWLRMTDTRQRLRRHVAAQVTSGRFQFVKVDARGKIGADYHQGSNGESGRFTCVEYKKSGNHLKIVRTDQGQSQVFLNSKRLRMGPKEGITWHPAAVTVRHRKLADVFGKRLVTIILANPTDSLPSLIYDAARMHAQLGRGKRNEILKLLGWGIEAFRNPAGKAALLLFSAVQVYQHLSPTLLSSSEVPPGCRDGQDPSCGGASA